MGTLARLLLIHAPHAARAPSETIPAAACARSDRPADEVGREMAANDRSREAYVRHFYRCDPAQARHYHLVVDSTALPLEVVIDLVVTAAGHRSVLPSP